MDMIQKDIWKTLEYGYFDAVCIITNGEVSEGSAIMKTYTATYIKDMFPTIDSILGDYLSRYGIRVFKLGVIKPKEDINVHIVSFPSKYYNKDKSNVQLIYHSYKELIELMNKNKWYKVLLPIPIEEDDPITEADLFSLLYPIYDKRIQLIKHK